MNKLLLFTALAATLTAPLAVQADDALRGAQVTLRNAGYYTGPVDGELNADTKTALRRYQIRNQLEPTGEWNAETAAALAKESGQAAAAVSAPEAPAAAPAGPAPVAVAPPPLPENPAYAALFARTPYQNAAPELQFRTLRQAQVLLGQRGFYRGVPDGRPSPGMEEALLRFQAERGLSRTGRLDIDTLAELHLLPVAKLPRPRTAPQPYQATVPSAPGDIPRAVRGVPVD